MGEGCLFKEGFYWKEGRFNHVFRVKGKPLVGTTFKRDFFYLKYR